MGAIEGENNKQIRSWQTGFYPFQGEKRNGREYVHWFVIVYQIFEILSISDVLMYCY